MTGQQRYLVRDGFTECQTWRDALGNAEPLAMFADHGYCLDAPEYVPAGGMESSNYGPQAQVANRTPWIA